MIWKVTPAQRRRQDFFHRCAQLSKSICPLPPAKKQPSWLKIWLRWKLKSFFFRIWNDISNLSNTLSRFGSIDWCKSVIYHTIKLYTFPDASGICKILLLDRFVVFKQMQRVNQIEKVPIWSSLYRVWIQNFKWIRCLVNSQCLFSASNFSNFSGYFSAFGHRSLQ